MAATFNSRMGKMFIQWRLEAKMSPAQQFAFIISRLFLVVLLFDCLNPSIGLVVFAFN